MMGSDIWSSTSSDEEKWVWYFPVLSTIFRSLHRISKMSAVFLMYLFLRFILPHLARDIRLKGKHEEVANLYG